MQKQIKFIYALLIITIIGGGMVFFINNKIDMNDESKFSFSVDKNNKIVKLDSICRGYGLVNKLKDTDIDIYDSIGGKIIKTVSNNLNTEDYLSFKILEQKGDFFKVNIGSNDSNSIIGWIRKSDYLGTYVNNYSDDSFIINSIPQKNAKHIKVKKIDPEDVFEFYQIIGCSGEWVEIKTNSKDGFTGWLDPSLQCNNSYTTCN